MRGPNEALASAQARKERAIADLKELELKRKTGELVCRKTVDTYIQGMIIKARDVLLRIDCDERVKGEINRALKELATYMG